MLRSSVLGIVDHQPGRKTAETPGGSVSTTMECVSGGVANFSAESHHLRLLTLRVGGSPMVSRTERN